jgi:hypothetical protein
MLSLEATASLITEKSSAAILSHRGVQTPLSTGVETFLPPAPADPSSNTFLTGLDNLPSSQRQGRPGKYVSECLSSTSLVQKKEKWGGHSVGNQYIWRLV